MKTLLAYIGQNAPVLGFDSSRPFNVLSKLRRLAHEEIEVPSI